MLVVWRVRQRFADFHSASVEYGDYPYSRADVHNSRIEPLEGKEAIRDGIERERRLRIINAAEGIMTAKSRMAWATRNFLWEATETNEVPTGLFVVSGNYSWNWPYNPYTTVVKVTPGETGTDLEKRLQTLYPQGFENIPEDSRVLPGTSHGELVTYTCRELTGKAAELIDWEPTTV